MSKARLPSRGVYRAGELYGASVRRPRNVLADNHACVNIGFQRVERLTRLSGLDRSSKDRDSKAFTILNSPKLVSRALAGRDDIPRRRLACWHPGRIASPENSNPAKPSIAIPILRYHFSHRDRKKFFPDLLRTRKEIGRVRRSGAWLRWAKACRLRACAL